MKVLVIGDPHGVLPKKIPKADLNLCTGDLPKADLARSLYLSKSSEERDIIKKDPKIQRKIWDEVYYSTKDVLEKLPKNIPTYSILGNAGTATDYEIKKDEERLGIKLPRLRSEIENTKNFYLVRNVLRNINGLRVGFLEYFIDTCWLKEFGIKDKKRFENAKRQTEKAKRILNGFGKVDILVCHQPPYGYLDKVSGKYGAPKPWIGKHAGSKVILNYIKKNEPRYVFCGHLHEGKGKAKIGKSKVYNVGYEGDYVLVDVNKN
ncbi:MAG: metallophosphoesterase [Candidatus Pacearchaeota archaeon]|jgi:Icc-related predicted phosphoesterase